MTLGKRIASARHEAGLHRVEELAALIAKSPWTVRDYERDRAAPPLDVLRRIAEVTGKPVSWFLGEDSEADTEAAVIQAVQEWLRRREQGQPAEPPGTRLGDTAAFAEFERDAALLRAHTVTEEELALLRETRFGGLGPPDKDGMVELLLLLRRWRGRQE